MTEPEGGDRYMRVVVMNRQLNDIRELLTEIRDLLTEENR